MPVVLNALEPFAMDLWKKDLEEWLPLEDRNKLVIRKELYFGGLYQKVVVTKEE